MDKFVLFISELEDISEIIDGLKSHGIQFQVSQDVGEIEAILRKRKPSLIVLKDKLRKLKSEELLTKIITVDESCFFVVFSDQADVEQAKKFIDLGAWDFWIAPLHLEKILIIKNMRKNSTKISHQLLKSITMSMKSKREFQILMEVRRS